MDPLSSRVVSELLNNCWIIESTKMKQDDLPEFDPLHYTQQDYLYWGHINKVSQYLPRSCISSLAEAKALIMFKDDQGRCPIHVAVERNDVDALQSFLVLGNDVNHLDGSKKTPIFYAVAGGNREMIDILLQHGAETNIQDEEGDSLLHVAAMSCKPEAMAEFILQAGIPIDSKDNHHWTPLHMCSWFGCKKVADLLLEKGANVDALTDTKVTPLIMAIGRKHLDVAEALLRKGADPNLQPNNGWTALHRAAAVGDADGTKLLLSHGANMYLTDNMGRTPMHIAIERNSVGAIKVLTKNGYELSKEDYVNDDKILYF